MQKVLYKYKQKNVANNEQYISYYNTPCDLALCKDFQKHTKCETLHSPATGVRTAKFNIKNSKFFPTQGIYVVRVSQ
jgi:hypothetical protein